MVVHRRSRCEFRRCLTIDLHRSRSCGLVTCRHSIQTADRLFRRPQRQSSLARTIPPQFSATLLQSRSRAPIRFVPFCVSRPDPMPHCRPLPTHLRTHPQPLSRTAIRSSVFGAILNFSSISFACECRQAFQRLAAAGRTSVNIRT